VNTGKFNRLLLSLPKPKKSFSYEEKNITGARGVHTDRNHDCGGDYWAASRLCRP
jgi:hypothetical protein